MRPLTCFIETVPLLTHPSGLANYVVGLIQGLARVPDPVRCLTGLASWRSQPHATLARRCQDLGLDLGISRVPLPNRVATRLPRLADLLARPSVPPVDVVHATANSFSSWLPVKSGIRVLTIHDVVFLRHRDGTLCCPELAARMSARLPGDCAAADLIVTDSEFSKAEICELLRLPPAKVAVAHLASSLPETTPGEAVPMAVEIAQALAAPFLPYVGSIDARKNITGLLAAFRAMREGQPDARLVMVGRPGWRGDDYAREIEGTAGVQWIPGCSTPDLIRLYQAARGFLLVSWYEGFGLPLLEAMSHGCPACYAVGSSMDEVAGETCIGVRPDDHGAIVEAMQLFWQDDSCRRTYGLPGKARSASFTWEQTARQTLASYRAALEVAE